MIEINDLMKDTKYFYEGNPVPRVTTVISKMIHEDYLLGWANSLGFKRKSYKDELGKAAYIGNATHHRIEEILHGSVPKEDELFTVQSFLKWYKGLISYNRVKVIFTEKTLVCNLFGGTLDCLLSINDKLYLIDFKTSNHVTYKYFLQLAAYRKMLRDVENIELDGLIILQLDKSEANFEEYAMNTAKLSHLELINHFEKTFISLVEGYMNILIAQKYYTLYLKERS